MKNGYLQATIVYKVTKPGGFPLDINGELCSVSDLKQAVYLLFGTDNPDPLLYEVIGYYYPNDMLYGVSTSEYKPEVCPVGTITITPTSLLLSPSGPLGLATLYSTDNWTFISGTSIAALSQIVGVDGFTYLEFTPTAFEGQSYFVFQNDISGDTAQIYVINTSNPSLWILDAGIWHDLGFWFDTSIWTF